MGCIDQTSVMFQKTASPSDDLKEFTREIQLALKRNNKIGNLKAVDHEEKKLWFGPSNKLALPENLKFPL